MPGAAAMTVREAAAYYASLGIRVIPLHGIENGRCTCGKQTMRQDTSPVSIPSEV